MSLFFQVIDFKATKTTDYEHFQIVPPDLSLYEKANIDSDSDYGIMKCVSKFFKDRKLNMIFIKDIAQDRKDSFVSHFNYYDTLMNTLKNIIEIYSVQNNALIINDILKVEPKYVIDASRFVGFVTMEGLLTRKDADQILLYCNDIVGNKFYELGNNIWS